MLPQGCDKGQGGQGRQVDIMQPSSFPTGGSLTTLIRLSYFIFFLLDQNRVERKGQYKHMIFYIYES